MSSDKDKCVKEGYVWLPPQGVLSQLKKSWQRKYCKLYKASKYGIERLEVFDSEEEAMKTSLMPIITLENCIKITEDTQKHNQPHVFLVVTKTNIQHFAANSEEDMWQWVTALQSVAFKDSVSRQTIEEDNELYCSSEDSGVFSVRLVASEASERCGLAPGPYTLVVTQSALHLRDDQRVLYIWPYRFIRRYGHRQGKFTFEAGRKCESGEGTFHMEHSNQQEIFRCISSKMKNMKKLLTGESLSSPAILCGDNQFHAALNMMARSRSPLPPSPTGSTPLLDAELCSISSAKPLIPVPVEPLQRSLKPPLPFKPKPMKPPRKNLPAITVNDSDENCSKEHQNQNADNCADYDDIEVRNDAWKTMGLGVMPHSERPFSSRTEEPLEMQTNWQQCEEHHYDKLQHLGPTNKPHPRPGYRQIVGIAPALPPPCASEDTVRAADDSHLGYGVIRKKPVPAEETQPANVGPPHQVYNNMEYAIVCKPNRV
ncbi:docking protein 2 isoform X2 [Homalodisca vitripennis]|uniref:docking protein 2 isoform X2 n=1 Tax=Homalodisca vitripennis TaxID=197043 RepID=UPI001EEBF246|nr:docking protein 2 isoform X2 [Homalodisca vitripennis]